MFCTLVMCHGYIPVWSSFLHFQREFWNIPSRRVRWQRWRLWNCPLGMLVLAWDTVAAGGRNAGCRRRPRRSTARRVFVVSIFSYLCFSFVTVSSYCVVCFNLENYALFHGYIAVWSSFLHFQRLLGYSLAGSSLASQVRIILVYCDGSVDGSQSGCGVFIRNYVSPTQYADTGCRAATRVPVVDPGWAVCHTWGSAHYSSVTKIYVRVVR